MKFIIAAILIAAILSVIAYFNRKKIYKDINELEKRKVEIMNRPVTDELTKVKRLNMTGQTEEMFDRWRQTWDEVLGVDLADVEEKLFEAEERADQFRFGKSKEINESIENRLEEAEQKVNGILTELNDLIGSEESNRKESEELKEKRRAARKQLLAHRHTFGKAASLLEIQLDALSSEFDKFEELTNEGNYLAAREIILKLTHDMDTILHKMEVIPVLMAETTNLLPAQLAEIESGYKEMTQNGYLLDHLQLEKEVASLRKQLSLYKDFIVKTETSEVEAGIQEVKDNIEFFYELLEKEVDAKHFIVKNEQATRDQLENIRNANEELQTETEHVRQSYQLAKEEWIVPRKLEEDIFRLIKRYDLLETKITQQNTAYSFLHDELQELKAQLEELQKEQESFGRFLKTLRKDEMAARESLAELRKKINEIFRMVNKSNMPGVPEFYQSLTEETTGRIGDVVQALNEKPLNMKAVQEKLGEAVSSVSNLERKTVEVIEQAELAERIIQYGNRYKRSHPMIGDQLSEAERAFRNYDYRSALEEAATAIDKVDPKGLKQLEDMMNKK
ncbi:septation ring formation regulator EzrA [Pseudobacillus wudalianchiensis]|uniref:Septation ring formation regulator EzrA n=1 Tax=Pseudobacillus wudalianchiensis TaxID=1743143 RepID=A0A1B9B824_9BACI|nr:septation ring formation regulator EzrA [Bacillus wudalianchiensis]OCA92238.1 septation ring formation regulator EzrA [Bacillus wudalianchiensis]